MVVRKSLHFGIFVPNEKLIFRLILPLLWPALALSPLSSLFDIFRPLALSRGSGLGSLTLLDVGRLVSGSFGGVGGSALLRVLQQTTQTFSLASFMKVQCSQDHSSLRSLRFVSLSSWPSVAPFPTSAVVLEAS